MITFEFETDDGLSKIVAALSPSEQTRALLQAGKVAGVAAEGAVSEYPLASKKPLPLAYTRISTAKKPYRLPDGTIRRGGDSFKSKFASRKQQGKVFTLRKAGAIPYRRTGQLGRSITSNAVADGGDVLVTVGSNLSYAPYVIDKASQSAYHKGNWTPIQDDIERDKAQILRAAQAAYVTALQKAIR
jgi:hypothetical protein